MLKDVFPWSGALMQFLKPTNYNLKLQDIKKHPYLGPFWISPAGWKTVSMARLTDWRLRLVYTKFILHRCGQASYRRIFYTAHIQGPMSRSTLWWTFTFASHIPPLGTNHKTEMKYLFMLACLSLLRKHTFE